MKIEKTAFDGVYVIKCFNVFDSRGSFTKVFNKKEYSMLGLDNNLEEVYYTISKKDVIRGMHFQLPPYDHEKIVHVINGEIIDVILDLRKKSKTYKKYMEINMKANSNDALYIPKGFAHGFKSLTENTTMLYQVSSEYNKYCDTGILYNSFQYDWCIDTPIMSERDKNFVPLQDFQSPF